jgi:uncharacterized protein
LELIAARFDVDLQDKNGTTPLYAAAAEGHAAVTKQLIEARCNIDFNDANVPLQIAAAHGHAAVTKQLIEARCNVDLQNKNLCTPLYIAAEMGMLPSRSS